MTHPRGRPQGTKHRTITERMGVWSWDGLRLEQKVQKTTPELCWSWLGAKGPQGNLYGAYKNDKPRMSQANRLFYMQTKGIDIADSSIQMRCGNKYCCNVQHMTAAQPNYKTGKNRPSIAFYKFSIDDDRFCGADPELQQLIRSLARDYAEENGIDWDWRVRWMKITEANTLLAEIKYPGVLAMFARSEC